MIGTTGATVVSVVIVLFAAILGVGAGGLACLVLRQLWGLKVALIDAAIAAAITVIAAYIGAAIAMARGVWESRVALILIIAVGSVVVRHLIRLALRSAH